MTRTLFKHPDGGTYERLGEVSIKCPATGKWLDGVLYRPAGDSGAVPCATTVDRWLTRFSEIT